jgi:hypothetical protein
MTAPQTANFVFNQDVAFSNQDVGTSGNPSLAGSFVTNRIDPYLGSPVYQEIGGGSDIWDPDDHFQYAFTRVMGDFDVMVNVLSLVGPDNWSKAEFPRPLTRASRP